MYHNNEGKDSNKKMNTQTYIQQQQPMLVTKTEHQEQSMNWYAIASEDPEFAYVLERRKFIADMKKKHEEDVKRERERRLNNTMQYVQQVFIHAGASVEDVEKVCDVIELFICADCIKPGKMFRIPYNKKLRNAELKCMLNNIVRYNDKDHSTVDFFLQTSFGEWFKVKDKDNISKNYNKLPNDSCVTKDGLEADLERLQSVVNV